MKTGTHFSTQINGQTHARVYAEKTPVRPQPRIDALLKVLTREAGKTVSRQQLLDEIWDGDPNRNEALTAAVCALRRHLHDDCQQPRYVETVRGQGYRLIARFDAGEREQPRARADNEGSLAGDNPAPQAEEVRHPFVQEMVRRRVFRVLGLYLIIGWIVMQVGEVTFEPLGVPAWCLTLMALLIGLGFPIAAVLAWAFQVTPAGVVLDIPKADATGAKESKGRQRLQMLIIASLICALGSLGYRLFELESRQAGIAPVSGAVVDVAKGSGRTSPRPDQRIAADVESMPPELR